MSSAVLTRELDAHSGYIAALGALGLDVVTMPVTHTEPPRDPLALPRALEHGGHAAIVIVSARGAAALAQARAHVTTLPEVFAVGPATHRALAAAGITAQHPPDAIDGASLAQAMIASRELAGRRVLVPRAEDGRDDVITVLRSAGIEVVDVIAYRTVPTAADDPVIAEGAQLLSTGTAAVCAVFAPSQVAALAALLGPLAAVRVPFVAIGDTTAAVLREAGVANIAVAASPTPEGLANAVASVYTHRP
ncbi:MAG: uroporphyrinogen-III synthase [Deltaproteobacteria bacterium]|nr:uroporphyrinogen-III synthase [Deltaproteobacteria bacterium]